MLIDTHAHLSMLARRGIDPHDCLRSLFAEGFAGIIDISLNPGDLPRRITEFSNYPRVFFAAGLWPHADSITNREKLAGELERDIIAVKTGEQGQKFCALGEFGMDHNWNGKGKDGSADLEGERELMEIQMEIAQRLDLPVIIHSRDAAEETAVTLARYPRVRGVVHCFSYGPAEVKTFLDLGYYISFAGNITYKSAGNVQEACKLVPAERLFLETDCPYLAPVPHRGKPAHPGMVEEVYKHVSEIRKTNLMTLAKQISENVKMLLRVDDGF
ncbi:MAG: TatD family hydrolase [Treponema sp.]|nr:TatD family hydrolase [Treponema sp.]